MRRIESAYFAGGKIEEPIENWKIELTKLIEKAHKEGKYIKSYYQQITFSPKGLAGCLIEGKFVWGVMNFTLIDPVKKPDYGDECYERVIGSLEKKES